MYDAQPQRDRHSFADYQEQGRRRGREVVAAVAAEHPDIAVPTYFIYGGLPGDPEAAAGARLEVDIYGLLPAFVEGMLAASTPSVTIVDGTESAYTFSELSQLQTAAVRLEVGGQRFVAPELRARFRAQAQIGLGLYVDGYNVPETSPWFVDGRGGARVLRLQDSLQVALATADEYLWLWGERGRWWPDPTDTASWGREVHPPWSEALPGSDLAMALARDAAGVLAGACSVRLAARGLTLSLAP